MIWYDPKELSGKFFKATRVGIRAIFQRLTVGGFMKLKGGVFGVVICFRTEVSELLLRYS